MAAKQSPFMKMNEFTRTIETPLFDDVYKQTKSFDFSPWGGIDGFLEASKSGQTGYNQKGAAYRIVVPDVFRAVDMTSVAVSSLPFDIMRGDEVIDSSTEWKNALGGMENPQRLLYSLTSSLCGGAAYIIPTITPSLIVDLQYIPPGTITFTWNQDGISQYFYTSQFGKMNTYTPDELIAIFFPDSDVEQGPAKAHPLGVALAAAQREFAMNNTINVNAERGFIPPTLLMVEGMTDKGQRDAAEAWWNGWLRGAFTRVAKVLNASKMDVKQVGAGMENLKQIFLELKNDAKEEVGQAFGIPAALFMSDKAFASEYDALIKQWYSSSVFVTIYQTIQESLSEQLFEQFDEAYMVFRPETIDAFQEDEAKKASAFREYASARIRPSIIAQMLGLEMPQGIEYAALDEDFDKPEPVLPVNPINNPEAPAQQPNQKPVQDNTPPSMPLPVMPMGKALSALEMKDLTTWYSTSKRWFAKNKGTAADWENKHLPEDIAMSIRDKLLKAQSLKDIDEAFSMNQAETRSEAALVLEGIRLALEKL